MVGYPTHQVYAQDQISTKLRWNMIPPVWKSRTVDGQSCCLDVARCFRILLAPRADIPACCHEDYSIMRGLEVKRGATLALCEYSSALSGPAGYSLRSLARGAPSNAITSPLAFCYHLW